MNIVGTTAQLIIVHHIASVPAYFYCSVMQTTTAAGR